MFARCSKVARLYGRYGPLLDELLLASKSDRLLGFACLEKH